MGNTTIHPTVQIQYEQGNIENVPAFEDIHLTCSAVGPAEKDYLYIWRLDHLEKITQKNIVDITLSSDYCDKLLTLTVLLVPKRHEKSPCLSPAITPGPGMPSASFPFIAMCKTIEVRDLYFSDETGKMKLDSSAILSINQTYSIVAEISGCNSTILEGYLKVTINGRLKENFSHQLSKVKNNRLASLIWFTAKEIPTSPTASVEVELFLSSPACLKKKISMKVQNTPASTIEKIKGEIQPVVVGENSIHESNYNPCRYSQILVSLPKANPINLFNEGVSTSVVKPLQLIGGKKELAFQLANYKTIDCRTKTHTNNYALLALSNEAFEVINPRKSEPPDKILYPISEEGSFSISLRYHYPSLKEYFKLAWNPPLQKGKCYIHTCRYAKTIPVVIYPDIEWVVTLKLIQRKQAPSPPHMSHAEGHYQKEVEGAHQAGEERYIRKGKFTLEFSLGGSYDGNKRIRLADDLEISAQRLLDVFHGVYENLEQWTGSDIARTKIKESPLLSKLPFTLSFTSPMFFISAAWKYAYDAKGDILRTGTFSMNLDPLIRLDGKINVLACAEYIPACKGIIELLKSGLGLAEKTVQFVSGGHVAFQPDIACYLIGFGKISASGELALSQESKSVDLTMKGSAGLGLELSIKSNIKFKMVYIMGNESTTRIGAGMRGRGETSFSARSSIGYEEGRGCYVKARLAYEGITLSIQGEAYVKLDENQDKEGYNFSIGCSNTFLKPAGPLLDGKYYIT